MLRRSKISPMPIQSQFQKYSHQQSLNLMKPQIFSSASALHRIQRKPRQDSGMKPSPLNQKYKSKQFLCKQKLNNNNLQGDKNTLDCYNIKSEYYDINKEVPKILTNEKSILHRDDLLPRYTPPHQQLSSVRSTPELDISPFNQQNDLKDKKEQESTSTEFSKLSDFPSQQFKSRLKQVKFERVIQTFSKPFAKKRDQTRSPSILKNGSRSILSSLPSIERSCSAASGKDIKSNAKNGGVNSANKIIKQKYKIILHKLQSASQMSGNTVGNSYSGAVYSTSTKNISSTTLKFKDEIFPPVYSSLFTVKRNRAKIGEQISWKRLGEIFEDRQIVVASQTKTLEITKGEKSYCADYFPNALNCLSRCDKTIHKIFEEQSVNPYGIYLLNIYQQSGWKYIIIDDYIPVIKDNQGKYIPAFIQVEMGEKGVIDIWPFLLQKAYANYYASYEALQHGNLLDFVQELTGTPSQKIEFGKQNTSCDDQFQKDFIQLKKQITTEELIIIGELLGQKGYISLTYSISTELLSYNDPFCDLRDRQITISQLNCLCTALHIIAPLKYSSYTSAVIRKQQSNSYKQINKGLFSNVFPIVRNFIVQQSGNFSIVLRQRQHRIFHFKQDLGQYIWCRMILLQKQIGDNGYRWIDGEYSQKKSVSFSQWLQTGQYWLLIEAEWKNNSPNELTLLNYGNAPCYFNKPVYKQEEKMLQSGCMDLAQRFGQLNQISKFICSYHYTTQKNIINERVRGDITVMRSIQGLQCKGLILPANAEFYQPVMHNGQKMLRLHEQVLIDIPKASSYTVVLKMRGGIDKLFFKSFNFGC